VFQPSAPGALNRRREQAHAGQAPQPDHQVQVFGALVGKASQGEEQVAAHEQSLVAIGQTAETAAPVGPPGDKLQEGGWRQQAQLKGPGPDPGIGGGPAQRRHMGRHQHGIDVQEDQEVSPGHPGPRIHLGPPSPGRLHLADMGKPGRHLQGGIGAAAVHHDDLQIRVRGQARQGLGQDGSLIEYRDNKGNVWLRRGDGGGGERRLPGSPGQGTGAAPRRRRRAVL
jgi:hypothetical protein